MALLPFEMVKREVLVKREADTDPSFGYLPDKRPTELLLDFGVINVNKPKGPTSHMVSDFVQRILHIDKAGHGGSLDPAVTGVLPVAIGRATRIVQALLPAGKEYVCIMHLHDDVSEGKVRAAVKEFVGRITQLPPRKSAVVRRERERDIYYLDILEIEGRDVLFKMGCQAGTYVRKVCHDLGLRLNVGAHMAELIRTKAGPFSEKDMVSLQDLEDAYAFWKEEQNDKFLRHCIKPVEFAVQHLPKVWIQDSAIDTLCHGASLNVPGVVKLESGIVKDALVAVLTLKGELVGLGEAFMTSEQMIKEEKGLCVKVSKVFMKEGTYPRMRSPQTI
ncbi:RNA-guided pseudouridylation complex pseudouridine synthase subunit Cbf5 [Candidatus Woesearchaeota archaeon]|nr:RNA-guided pseudouridylation complex pseudouridine synthase subunit Cbf5 [Candidatus Woesearchaeota archaeon]